MSYRIDHGRTKTKNRQQNGKIERFWPTGDKAKAEMSFLFTDGHQMPDEACENVMRYHSRMEPRRSCDSVSDLLAIHRNA
jgi:transposase InsO family protein